MCTMMLKEAIVCYVNNGNFVKELLHIVSNGISVFCMLLDATKAFNRVEYVKMFKLFLGRSQYVHFAGDTGEMEWRLFRLLQHSERSKTRKSD